MEVYGSERYAAVGYRSRFMQDNLSRSGQGNVRGLHFQNPNPQGKLVTVLRGSVLDIAVDVRKGSSTFGKHVRCELTEENRRQMWVPRGFFSWLHRNIRKRRFILQVQFNLQPKG